MGQHSDELAHAKAESNGAALEARAVLSIEDLDAAQWDRLVADDNPFCRHTFLRLLEQTQCACPETGWQPFHTTLWRGTKLVAAAPSYLKSHSYGEFVFDWSWAHAYEQHGLRYYPKLLCAIPMSPVTGPRLLTGESSLLKPALSQAMLQMVASNEFSSAHINFTSAADYAAMKQAIGQQQGWLARRDIQFHWPNRGYQNFAEFLAALTRKKSKNIRQERARVAGEGWTFTRIEGSDAEPSDMQLMHQLYLSTFDKKGNWAPLTVEFFQQLIEQMPDNVTLIFAEREGRRLAGALFLTSNRCLYGRYWGSLVDSPGLHFETCYYQGIEHAIERGLRVFEPGAQGQHKLARGFIPVETHSFHHLRDAHFASAVGRALSEERRHHQLALSHFADHQPYRQARDSLA